MAFGCAANAERLMAPKCETRRPSKSKRSRFQASAPSAPSPADISAPVDRQAGRGGARKCANSAKQITLDESISTPPLRVAVPTDSAGLLRSIPHGNSGGSSVKY